MSNISLEITHRPALFRGGYGEQVPGEDIRVVTWNKRVETQPERDPYVRVCIF
jgi:hypothetical protein